MANNKKRLEGADFYTAPAPAAKAAPAPTPTPATPAAPAPAATRPLGLRTGNVTACFKIDATLLAKLKAVAYWDRRTNKDVLEEALAEYFTKYEDANGAIDVNIPRNLG